MFQIKPYIRFEQNGRSFYVGIMDASHLEPDSVPVDVWTHKTNEGYQREPDVTRVREITEYLRIGGVMPGALLLNARGGIREVNGALEIDGDLYLYDGQHRRDGAVALALQTDTSVQFPVVISTFSSTDEALRFLVENRTQKGVRADLAERIIEEGRIPENYPLPRSLQRWVPIHQRTLRLCEGLNVRQDSPFFGKIQPPNVRASRGAYAAKQISVTSSLEPIVRKLGMEYEYTDDEIVEGLVNFWKAVKALCTKAFGDHTRYVIQRTTGLYALHEVFIELASLEPDPKKWIVTYFQDRLNRDRQHMNSGFWLGQAPTPNHRVAGEYGTSRKAFSKLAKEIVREIRSASRR